MAQPILSFPTATPGEDSVQVIVQKGVRYIGRVDTDGPAVWEAIANFFNADSQRTITGGMQDLFSQFITTLPNTDPLIKGRLWNNSGIITVSSGINSEQGL